MIFCFNFLHINITNFKYLHENVISHICSKECHILVFLVDTELHILYMNCTGTLWYARVLGTTALFGILFVIQKEMVLLSSLLYIYALLLTFLMCLYLVLHTQLPLEDPKRFRIEMTFSRGADLSPLEVIILSLIRYETVIWTTTVTALVNVILYSLSKCTKVTMGKWPIKTTHNAVWNGSLNYQTSSYPLDSIPIISL